MFFVLNEKLALRNNNRSEKYCDFLVSSPYAFKGDHPITEKNAKTYNVHHFGDPKKSP